MPSDIRYDSRVLKVMHVPKFTFSQLGRTHTSEYKKTNVVIKQKHETDERKKY